MSAADAQKELREARRAAEAARRPVPLPAHVPPVVGLLVALGFAGLAGALRWANVLPAVFGIACLLAFVVVVFRVSRRGGVALLPAGSMRQRWLAQVPDLVVLLVAAVLAISTGGVPALLVLGVGFGALFWVRLSRGSGRRR